MNDKHKSFLIVVGIVAYIFIGAVFGQIQYNHHPQWDDKARSTTRDGNAAVQGVLWPVFLVIEVGLRLGDGLS